MPANFQMSSPPVWVKRSTLSGLLQRQCYAKCFNDDHGGSPADCIADEKSAYEVMIAKASQLMLEQRCAKEKASLKENIEYWKSIKDHDPDCDPVKK
jgi:hypothetical protein